MAKNDVPRPKEDLFSRLTGRREAAVALSILLVLPVLLFYATVLGDKQFMGHDTVQWRASAESIFEHRAEHDGEDPLWTSSMFGGMPAYTVHVAKSVPHLDNMVFDRLRVIWPAVPFWVLLGGAYLFFILMGFRPLAASLGAIFIGFTTYIPIIIGAGHNTKFIAYSYIPWMLAGYWMMTRSEKRWWGFFLFAVACTLNFRAGHPQVTYYFIYLFAGLFLYDSWRHYSSQELARWGKTTALIAAAVILAFLGTAEQYLKLMEYSPYSIRGGSAIAGDATPGGLTLEYAFSWSQGILETLTLLVPNLYGGDSGLAYWGEKPGTSGPHYLGAVAFLLFLIGLLRSRRTVRFLFLAVGLLTLTFSWGYNFPLNELWFNILPGFDKFRTPEMWLIVTVVTFSVIALFGIETIFDLFKKGKEGLKVLYLPAGISLAAGILILAASGLVLSFESERERAQISQQIAAQSDLSPDNRQVQQQTTRFIDTRLKPERRELARNDTFRYLLLVGGAILMIYFYFQAKISGSFMLLSLLVLAALDLLTVGNRYISDHALVDRQLEITDVVEMQASPVDSYLGEAVQSPDGYPYRVFPLDDNPFNNAVPSYFYPSLGGYSGAKLSVIQDLIDEGLFTGQYGLNLAALDMLNVRYISARRNIPLPGYEEVHSANDHRVFENQNVMPKAWFADSIRYAGSPLEAFGMIQPQEEFDPRQTAVVEGAAPGGIDVSPDSEATIRIDSYNDRRISLDVERSEPGFLVLSEIYYPPGWTALLNGEEVPIYKTNYLLRGVPVPAGRHELRLEFHPRSHILGSQISWAANLIQWLIGLGLLAVWWRRR